MENSLKNTQRVLHAKLGRTARLVYGFKSHLCSPHHYRSVLSTQKHAVEGLELYVQAGSDDKSALAIADAVNEDIINHADCMDLIKNALDALGKGFSVNEIIWDTSAKPLEIQNVHLARPLLVCIRQKDGRSFPAQRLTCIAAKECQVEAGVRCRRFFDL